MRINLFKSLTVGFLALSSLSLAHAQGPEYATVSINNQLDVTYYMHFWSYGDSFFPQSTTVQPDQDLTVTGNFYPSSGDGTNGAGFTLTTDPNNPYCTASNSQQLSGHCYVAEFTYSKYEPVPKVEITDNSQPCSANCTIKYNPRSNRNDIFVTINTSNK